MTIQGNGIHKVIQQSKLNTAELLRKILEEMRKKIEEGEVTQRLNKSQRIKTTKIRHIMLESRNWFGMREPETQIATKVPPSEETRPELWD